MNYPIEKIQNKFRWRIIIKGNMNEKANKTLNELLKILYDKDYKNTRVTIDVNPNNMVWPIGDVSFWDITGNFKDYQDFNKGDYMSQKDTSLMGHE